MSYTYKRKTNIKKKQSKQTQLENAMKQLQKQLQKALQTIDVYRRQIDILQQDNLNLCARISELKVREEVMMRKHAFQLDGMARKIQTTQSIITQEHAALDLRQQQLRIKEHTVALVEYKNNQDELQFAQKHQLLLRIKQLQLQLQNEQLKVLQSQKYWLSRTQTLLTQQKTDHEKAILMKQSRWQTQIVGLKDQLALKQGMVFERQAQIRELITFIRERSFH